MDSKNKYETRILADYNRIINNELTVDEFCAKNWELFLPVYIKLTRTRDDGDLYINLHNWVTHIIRLDVTPLFQSDGQLLNYYKKTLKNYCLAQAMKPKINFESLNALEEEVNFIPASTDDSIENVLSEMNMNYLFADLSTKLSEGQMSAILLIYKNNLSRKEASKKLGISIMALNDRLYRAKDIIHEAINQLQ